MSQVHALCRFLSYVLGCDDEAERARCTGILRDFHRVAAPDLVLEVLLDHLTGPPLPSPRGGVSFTGEHARAFAAFFNHSRGTLQAREEVSLWAQACPPAGVLRILDIGCGDGRALEPVLRGLRAAGTERFQLLLNDWQPSMIEAARTTLEAAARGLGAVLEVVGLPGRVQELPLAELAGATPLDLVTATASLHHMPREQKRTTLQALCSLAPRLLILSDANSDHDIHLPPRSPQLVANVYRFYNGLFQGLLQDGAGPEVLEAARLFLGREARDIILKPAAERFDYHTTVEHWIGLLTEAGFELLPPRILPLQDTPHRRLRARHVDTYIVDGEALLFSLAARPATGKSSLCGSPPGRSGR